ncbi:AbiJ-NTD4 domain-containing protein [Seonamhaeicola sp. ML3]|uniref:AbiJ-NTD4 domain-containing protein n=1 Tax=Seonamhaeicola sp. ML3 TaxID=2937786 RepID=UPI00200C8962|nr:hypothetical protein [Seonamhaeicola sp. ML3]
MKGRKFSERIGKSEIKTEIQLDYIDDDLRNSLWNVVIQYINEPLRDTGYLSNSKYKRFIQSLWFNHFKETLDKIPSVTTLIRKEIRSRFFSWNYLELYDFIDFIVRANNLPFKIERFANDCNYVLKRELSGYRFVNLELAPITDEVQIAGIEDAINQSTNNGFVGVNLHLTNALNKLSDRQNPDYRNSIKESISAVESICQQITGDNKAELGKAIKKIKKTLPIHGALEQGFIKLYGYTSDGDGIRHAMMEEDNLDQEDALYMLVSCSSFASYLMVKWNKLNK